MAMAWEYSIVPRGSAAPISHKYSVYRHSPRSPDLRVRGPEERLDRGPNRCGKVRNPGVVPHENSGPSQPACQFIQVFNADRTVKLLFGSAKPVDWHCFPEFPCRT